MGTDECYSDIDDNGVIGNMKTIALVDLNGIINFWCFPHFDSGAIFCSLLDYNKGGSWQICLEDYSKSRHYYYEDSNVLITRFFKEEGTIEVIDYMPVKPGNRESRELVNGIIRKVRCLSSAECTNPIKVTMTCNPTFNFAQSELPSVATSNDNKFITWSTPEESIELSATVVMHLQGNCAYFECEIKEGEEVTFIMQRPNAGKKLELEKESKYLAQTLQYWRKWIKKCNYSGRWRELVRRSALVLKLLTFENTGAIVAAGTTSLPENEKKLNSSVKGEVDGRNWDYRYVWIRDASFTMYSLIKIGLFDEAEQFVIKFLKDVLLQTDANTPLDTMFCIHPEKSVPEETDLDLSGYRNSRPVRIGNNAAKQLQLDIYGELLDSLYLYNKYVYQIPMDFWEPICKLLTWLSSNWQNPDDGIWETRGGRKQFTYSKVMSWVAFDRALKMVRENSLPIELETKSKWEQTCTEIFQYVYNKCWCDKRKAFVQYAPDDGDTSKVPLDASLIKMSLVKFLPPNDPRILSTLDNIAPKNPSVDKGLIKNGLIARYTGEDGLLGEEGTFTICTLWYIEAMALAGKFNSERMSRSRQMLDNLIHYANAVGLMSEEISRNGTLLGNFPQAFSHLGLIASIINLNEIINDQEKSCE